MQVIIDMKWITDEIERLDKPLTHEEYKQLGSTEVYRIQGQLIALERLKKKN